MRRRRHAMKTKWFCLSAVFAVIAALVPLRTPAQSQNSGDELREMRKLIEELRTQMSTMQAEIDQLKDTKLETSSPLPASASALLATPQAGPLEAPQPAPESIPSEQVGEATAEYQEFNEDTLATARFDNVPLDPKYEGYFKLPGTRTSLRIGGFFKTDFIYDLKPAGNTYLFIPSSFPTPQASGVYNANVSIRTTRLSLDFRTPSRVLGDLRFYL